jgi:hypothetical protein
VGGPLQQKFAAADAEKSFFLNLKDQVPLKKKSIRTMAIHNKSFEATLTPC